MGETVHTNDGIEMPKRFARAKEGNCPVCGEPYQDSMEMEHRIEDGEKHPMEGIAYEHQQKQVCIEWADGKIESDGRN